MLGEFASLRSRDKNIYPTNAVIAATAPSVTSAVENQRTATNNHTGRGLGLVYTGTLLQDSSAGSALRNAAAARSMSAMSRESWSLTALAGEAELSVLSCAPLRCDAGKARNSSSTVLPSVLAKESKRG
jgi:hypothetical protein